MILLTPSVLLMAHLSLAPPEVEGISDHQVHAEVERVLAPYGEAVDNPIAAWRKGQDSAEHVRTLLRSKGYYGARVIPRVAEDNHVILDIDLGPAYTLSSLSVNALDDEEAAETARDAITLQLESPVLAQAVIDAETQGLAALQTSGWPDAETRQRQVTIDHATAQGEIRYNFRPGPFSTNGDIRVETEAWRADYIRRLSPLSPGEPTSREALNAYQRNLQTLASVAQAEVSLNPAIPGETARSITVNLEPRKRHVIETALSYSTSQGAGSQARWQRRNMYGGDETLTASAQLATMAQGLEAQLNFPHWRRLDQTLKLSSGFLSEQTDAYDQNELHIGAQIIRQNVGPFTLSAGVRLDGSQVTEQGVREDYLSLEFPLSALYDTRNSPLNPTEGWNAGLAITPVATLGEQGSGYARIDTQTASYWALSDTITLAGRIRLGSLLGASNTAIPADHRFFAGGGGSARGFEYQSLSPLQEDGTPLGGRSVFEANTEVRWRVKDKWGVVGFVDGAVASDDTTPIFDDIRYGIGFGVRYYLDFAPIRVDIATPLDRQSGEDTFQLYLSLGQAF